MDFDQILDHVYVGSYPELVMEIDRLKREAGVTAVLNLQTDEDLDRFGVDWPALQVRYRRLKIELRRVPVRDFDPQDLQDKLVECVRVLDQLLRAGHTVFVHCTAGAGRSPNAVIAYLHWVKGWDLDEAIEHVSSRRPCVPNPEAIRLAGGRFGEDSGDAVPV
jgi:protein-tyrosine phosphatase